ncbi:MAG: tRNA (adenosine(37)-N6)-threonylcarbamoyltransferase complex dimerization subunit type 1 TsaB [Nocardioides sp.]|uniref:tRNA (adenosine(37)-N6)-threonylcarbamoyltransferase complex dimerization subunit type 1 TsaB n=1 Tax=Nocardioides sp. TaxID=35761 RepID=UPI0039E24846
MLLAFDTATAQIGVAVLDPGTGRVLSELADDRPMKHGERLAPLIREALAAAGVDRGDLTGIAVGAGPGPFTGLRVGLVTARTLGHVLGIEVHAVCTLDVIAGEAAQLLGLSFTVATDARRKEVYLATYDADGRRLGGPEVRRPADIAAETAAAPTAGVGAVLYPETFSHPVGPNRPSAAWLGRLVCAGRVDLLDPEPLYLRRPDAVERVPR